MLVACRLAGLSALEADIRAFTPTRNQDKRQEALRLRRRESLSTHRRRRPRVFGWVSCKRDSRQLASRSAALRLRKTRRRTHHHVAHAENRPFRHDQVSIRCNGRR
jgi:hypothetical protein